MKKSFLLSALCHGLPITLHLAFVKTDETDVPEYSIQMFEGECPSLTPYAYYPGEFVYKYPVAGTKNSKVAVFTYTVETRAVKKMNVPVDEDSYIHHVFGLRKIRINWP